MGRQLRILVVDDDEDNAQSLAELFELVGHQTVTVNSGEDAVAAYLSQSFDFAFMDVMMPGMNGVESFLLIKKMKPEAKVVMMTGYSVEQLLQQAMENGALGVLSKPMDPSKILGIVSEIGPNGIVVAQNSDSSVVGRVTEILTRAGRNCQLMRTRDEAFQYKPESPRDILIFDLHKPLIEGVCVYSEMKRAGVCGQTVILTDTEPQQLDTYELLKDFRATGILNKPFDPEQLLSRLHSLAI